MFRPEPWWLLLPFVVILAPPVGLLLVILAAWRSGGGLEGHRTARLNRLEARQKFVPPAWVAVHEAANR